MLNICLENCTLYAMHFNVSLRDQLKFWHDGSNKSRVPLCKLEIKLCMLVYHGHIVYGSSFCVVNGFYYMCIRFSSYMSLVLVINS